MITFGRCQVGHYYYTPTSPVLKIWGFGIFSYQKFLETETTLKILKARKEVEAMGHKFTCGCGEKSPAVIARPKERIFLKCWACGHEEEVTELIK